MFEQEPLLEELVPYISELENGMQVLRHPLVYSIPHLPALNAQCNMSYKMKKKALDACLTEHNYSQYIWLHERPYRLQAFLEIEDELGCNYWKLLSDVWVDSENIYQCVDDWCLALSVKKPNQYTFMNKAEYEAFCKLPEHLTIYRGYVKNPAGLSWTLDKDKAQWFAKRFSSRFGEGRITSKQITKDKVFAYLSRRSEEEIIIKPKDLQ